MFEDNYLWASYDKADRKFGSCCRTAKEFFEVKRQKYDSIVSTGTWIVPKELLEQGRNLSVNMRAQRKSRKINQEFNQVKPLPKTTPISTPISSPISTVNSEDSPADQTMYNDCLYVNEKTSHACDDYILPCF